MRCRWPRAGRPRVASCATRCCRSTLAELRQFRREGALVEAASQEGFALALLSAIEQQSDIALRTADGSGGTASFRQTPLFAGAVQPERLVVRRLGAEQSNTSVLFEEYGVLKVYRRLVPGVHPEIEMGRFLVERAGFANTPPLLGTIEMTLPAAEGGGGPHDDGAGRVVRVRAQSG